MLFLIAQIKRFGTLNATQKTTTLYKALFLKKSGSLTVKELTGAEKKVKKNFQKKNLKYWTKWNRKMSGRSCFITSGAFGHGLVCSVYNSSFAVCIIKGE